MSLFKEHVFFRLNFSTPFIVMTHNSSEIFQLKKYSPKVHPIPHAIFETTRSGIIQILHHCSVSWKITPLYFLAQTSYTLDKNSPSKWMFWTWTFEWLGEISPNLYFDGLLLLKYIKFQLKKYGGVMSHDTKECCKIWRKTDLLFGKWHEESSKFSSEHLKVSNLLFSWDPFVQSRKRMSTNLQRSYK